MQRSIHACIFSLDLQGKSFICVDERLTGEVCTALDGSWRGVAASGGLCLPLPTPKTACLEWQPAKVNPPITEGSFPLVARISQHAVPNFKGDGVKFEILRAMLRGSLLGTLNLHLQEVSSPLLAHPRRPLVEQALRQWEAWLRPLPAFKRMQLDHNVAQRKRCISSASQETGHV